MNLAEVEPKTSTFSNPNLYQSNHVKKAISDTLPIFSKFKDSLNQISEDIKEIENLLKNNGVCITYAIPLDSYFPPSEVTATRKYFIWKKDANSNYRLMFCKVFDGNPGPFEPGALEPFAWWNTTIYIAESTPFIETKSEIRYEYHKYLSEFVEGFAKHLEMQSSPFY